MNDMINMDEGLDQKNTSFLFLILKAFGNGLEKETGNDYITSMGTFRKEELESLEDDNNVDIRQIKIVYGYSPKNRVFYWISFEQKGIILK